MQHDLQIHQQNRLPSLILLCLHGYRHQQTAGYAQSSDSWYNWNQGLYEGGSCNPASQTKIGFSSRPDAVPVAPISTRTKKQQSSNERGGGGLGVAGGNRGRTGGLQQHHRKQPPADPSSPDSTVLKISAISNVTFTSLKSSTVMTRPHNQLSTVQEQYKSLWSILQGASFTLHTVLCGLGGTI